MVSIHGSAKTLDAFQNSKGLVLKSFKHEHWENNYSVIFTTENKRNKEKIRLLNRPNSRQNVEKIS
jgi:hypothetical protein